jgi:hypothetical protein
MSYDCDFVSEDTSVDIGNVHEVTATIFAHAKVFAHTRFRSEDGEDMDMVWILADITKGD